MVDAVLSRRVDSLDGLITLREGARRKQTTQAALDRWIRYHRIAYVVIGRTMLIKPDVLEGYQARGKRASDVK